MSSRNYKVNVRLFHTVAVEKSYTAIFAGLNVSYSHLLFLKLQILMIMIIMTIMMVVIMKTKTTMTKQILISRIQLKAWT